MEEAIQNSILIVDDEKTNLFYLNKLLCGDYVIYVAKSGREALKKANELLPDLILLDILMPGMSGYEVLAELKSSESTKEIPVIFITGLNREKDEEIGLSLNAADYIIKPFGAAIVKLRVGNQLRIVNQMRAIERLSMSDQLTGIANRRSFDQRIGLEWRRCAREELPISVIMIDVDRFKNYNDTYGHQQGDVVLRTIAGILTRSAVRPADFAARWGGEEFIILLPETAGPGALKVAERARACVEETEIPLPDGRGSKVTVSAGVNTQTPGQGDLIQEFLRKADQALYAAKEQGRNRVC